MMEIVIKFLEYIGLAIVAVLVIGALGAGLCLFVASKLWPEQ